MFSSRHGTDSRWSPRRDRAKTALRQSSPRFLQKRQSQAAFGQFAFDFTERRFAEVTHFEQLFIGVTSDQQWVRFTDAFALATLVADARLATNPMRASERVP